MRRIARCAREEWPSPRKGYRTRLTGLVASYGRRGGEALPPASNFVGAVSRRNFAIRPRVPQKGESDRRLPMLGWALTFLVIALIAAALGFGGIAGAAAGIAKII